MLTNIKLLQHVRRAVTAVMLGCENTEHRAHLVGAECLLNELMLNANPDFYLEQIRQGGEYLAEGRRLVTESFGSAPEKPDMVVPRVDLTTEHRSDVILTEVTKLHGWLSAIVGHLAELASPTIASYLRNVTAWECRLYQHSLEQPAVLEPTDAGVLTRESLHRYLVKKYPSSTGLTISEFTPLQGGFSKKTILFETKDALVGHQALVMRAEQPVNLLCYEGSDVTQEYYAVLLMKEAGLPVAEPLWLETDPTPLGARFFVSRKANGKTVGGNLGNTETLAAQLPRSIVAALVQLHSIKLDPSNPMVQKSHWKEWVPHTSISAATRYAVTVFLPRIVQLTGMELSPQLVRALRWLKDNVPDVDEPPVIVHQDFSFNNLIVDGDSIIAVLDWETSLLGDPALDIVWTQFTLRDHFSMDEFLHHYEAGTGRQITPFRLAYAQVAKLAFIVISCLGAKSALARYENAPINFGVMAFKYMGMFGTQFNQLILEAEAVKTK